MFYVVSIFLSFFYPVYVPKKTAYTQNDLLCVADVFDSYKEHLIPLVDPSGMLTDDFRDSGCFLPISRSRRLTVHISHSLKRMCSFYEH